MALSYSDVNHLTDLVRRVARLEETVEALQRGRDLTTEISALKMRLGSLQSQINGLRRGGGDSPSDYNPPETAV